MKLFFQKGYGCRCIDKQSTIGNLIVRPYEGWIPPIPPGLIRNYAMNSFLGFWILKQKTTNVMLHKSKNTYLLN